MKMRILLIVLVSLSCLQGCCFPCEPSHHDSKDAALINWFRTAVSVNVDEDEKSWLSNRSYVANLHKDKLAILLPEAKKQAGNLLAQVVLLKALSRIEALKLILVADDTHRMIFPILATLNESDEELSNLLSPHMEYLANFFMWENRIPTAFVDALKGNDFLEVISVERLQAISYYFDCGVTYEQLYKGNARYAMVSYITTISWLLNENFPSAILMYPPKVEKKEVRELFLEKLNRLREMKKMPEYERYVRVGIADHISMNTQIGLFSGAFLTDGRKYVDMNLRADAGNSSLYEVLEQMDGAMFQGISCFKNWELTNDLWRPFQVSKDSSGIDIYSPKTFLRVKSMFLHPDDSITDTLNLYHVYKTLYYMAYFGGHTKARSMYEFYLEILTSL